MAFTVDYNFPVLDTTTIQYSVTNSWLNSSPGVISAITLTKFFGTAQRIEVGNSRNNLQAVSGNGEIGRIIVVIDDNIAGKTAFAEDLILNLSGSLVISDDGSEIAVCEDGDTIHVVANTTSNPELPRENSGIHLYPNPAFNRLTIQSDENLELLEIVDMLGRSIALNLTKSGSSIIVDLNDVASGSYLVKMRVNKRDNHQKIYKTLNH